MASCKAKEAHVKTKKGNGEIRLLLRLLDQSYDKAAWHGPVLRGALRGVTVRQALWRPAPKRHNIWEIALHAAYWKYIVRRRLIGGDERKFPRPGSNWPQLPNKPNEAAWKKDLQTLQQYHDALLKTVRRFPTARLNRKPAKSIWTNIEHIYGIASHDLYHAGQIQLLKRLQRKY